MNKTQLIQHIAEQAGLTKQQATSALQAVETAIIDELVQNGEVSLFGLGIFNIKQRVERTECNPK